MGDIYGNKITAPNAQFQFDKIYSTRMEMDASADTDDVYINRFVLVNYGFTPRVNNFLKVKKVDDVYYGVVNDETWNEEVLCELVWSNREYGGLITYGESAEKIVAVRTQLQSVGYSISVSEGEVVLDITDEVEHIAFIKRENDSVTVTKLATVDASGNAIVNEENMSSALQYLEKNTDAPIEELKTNYVFNYAIDYYHYLNEDKESLKYYTPRGYDATVWQKAYNSEGKAEYILVAELNALVPSISALPVAPNSAPMAPYIMKKNNALYKLLQPSLWGFSFSNELKEDEDNIIEIDFNKEGFDIEKSHIVENAKDYFCIGESRELDEDGNPKYLYYTVDTNGATIEDENAKDLKIISLAFQSIGNIASLSYDLLYGEGERNTIPYPEEGYNKNPASVLGALNLLRPWAGQSLAELLQKFLEETAFGVSGDEIWINVDTETKTSYLGYLVDENNKPYLDKNNNWIPFSKMDGDSVLYLNEYNTVTKEGVYSSEDPRGSILIDSDVVNFENTSIGKITHHVKHSTPLNNFEFINVGDKDYDEENNQLILKFGDSLPISGMQVDAAGHVEDLDSYLFKLPDTIASEDEPGIVKVGAGLKVDEDDKLGLNISPDDKYITINGDGTIKVDGTSADDDTLLTKEDINGKNIIFNPYIIKDYLYSENSVFPSYMEREITTDIANYPVRYRYYIAGVVDEDIPEVCFWPNKNISGLCPVAQTGDNSVFLYTTADGNIPYNAVNRISIRRSYQKNPSYFVNYVRHNLPEWRSLIGVDFGEEELVGDPIDLLPNTTYRFVKLLTGDVQDESRIWDYFDGVEYTLEDVASEDLSNLFLCIPDENGNDNLYYIIGIIDPVTNKPIRYKAQRIDMKLAEKEPEQEIPPVIEVPDATPQWVIYNGVTGVADSGQINISGWHDIVAEADVVKPGVIMRAEVNATIYNDDPYAQGYDVELFGRRADNGVWERIASWRPTVDKKTLKTFNYVYTGDNGVIYDRVRYKERVKHTKCSIGGRVTIWKCLENPNNIPSSGNFETVTLDKADLGIDTETETINLNRVLNNGNVVEIVYVCIDSDTCDNSYTPSSYKSASVSATAIKSDGSSEVIGSRIANSDTKNNLEWNGSIKASSINIKIEKGSAPKLVNNRIIVTYIIEK